MRYVSVTKVLLFVILTIFGLGITCVSEELLSKGDVITAVAPVYPVLAYRARAHGTIQVEVEVDGKGVVTKATAEGNNLLLFRESCEKAALRWRFISISTESVKRKYGITFRFTLMPEYAKEDELTTIYKSPYEMEVRLRNVPPEPIN